MRLLYSVKSGNEILGQRKGLHLSLGEELSWLVFNNYATKTNN